MSKRLANILDKAADHLEQYGWMKDDFFEDADEFRTTLNHALQDDDWYKQWRKGAKNKPCCAMGVLYAVAPNSELYRDAERALSESIPSIRRGDYFSVPDWNDAKSRRKADVVKAFRRAAERQRNKK